MFGDILKKLREQSGISQRKLAEVLHVSQQTVGSWEVNRTTPSPEIMNKIADYFGVTLDSIYGRKTTNNSSQHESRATRIPVYGCVAAGIPIEAIDNFDSTDPDDWEEIDEHMSKDGEYFALLLIYEVLHEHEAADEEHDGEEREHTLANPLKYGAAFFRRSFCRGDVVLGEVVQ